MHIPFVVRDGSLRIRDGRVERPRLFLALAVPQIEFVTGSLVEIGGLFGLFSFLRLIVRVLIEALSSTNCENVWIDLFNVSHLAFVVSQLSGLVGPFTRHYLSDLLLYS